MFAACSFLDIAQENAKNAKPKQKTEQITIFMHMLDFFTVPAPFSYCEFRKFALAVLPFAFFANFANAAINVDVASNAEIADFMVSESKKILQIPDNAELTLNFQTARDRHGRAGLLFFWGEREVSIEAHYTMLPGNTEPLKGTIKADSSWFTGYCGMLECQSKPMPAQQRLDVLKALVSKMLNELNGKFYGVFAASHDQAAAPVEPDKPVENTDEDSLASPR
jgi:hypothetical protein